MQAQLPRIKLTEMLCISSNAFVGKMANALLAPLANEKSAGLSISAGLPHFAEGKTFINMGFLILWKRYLAKLGARYFHCIARAIATNRKIQRGSCYYLIICRNTSSWIDPKFACRRQSSQIQLQRCCLVLAGLNCSLCRNGILIIHLITYPIKAYFNI